MNPDDPLTCENVRPYFVAFLDQELPADLTLRIPEHIAACSACSRLLNEFVSTGQMTAAWRVENHADMWEGVREAIAPGNKRRVDSARILFEKHYVTQKQIEQARAWTRQTGHDIGNALVHLGFVSELDVVRAKAESEKIPFVDLNKHPPQASAINAVPEHIARKHNALPVRKDGQNLWVAMADPRNLRAADEIRLVSRYIVRPMAAVPDELARAIDAAYARPEAPPSDLRLILDELKVLRAEVADLRRQLAVVRPARKAVGAPLFPFAPPADPPARFS